jgi:hypothetical protein
VIPVVLAALVVWNLFDDLSKKGGLLRTPAGEWIWSKSWVWSNLVGLAVAVLAPVLAVLISSARSARDSGRACEDGQRACCKPRLSFVCVAVGAVLGLSGFCAVLAVAARERATDNVTVPVALLLLAILAGIIGIAAAQRGLKTDGEEGSEPQWSLRWTGVLGTLDVGGALGLLLALKSTRIALTSAAQESKAVVAPEMTGMAYAILAVIGVILVGGLGWCFFRAVSPSRDGNGTPTEDMS